ncbi:MAG: M1 family aminopeptidase [Flavobacteriia bacterium]|jgi:aminopeptidase N
MNRLFAVLTALVFSAVSFGQHENHRECSKRDRFKNQQLKSVSLNVAQIAETEKYDIHFYSLDLNMTNLNTDVAGTAEIHAKARVDLDSALFELFQTLTITEIRVNGNPVVFSRDNSAVKAPVNALAGDVFEIAIDYNGTPPNSVTNPLGGSGMTNDNSPSWGNQVTWSLSEPFSAYEWFPCKQSLTDKADSCAVKITVPDSCKAGSNGILENVVDVGNQKTRYEWKHRHPIDYYLISVSIAEYVEYNVFANPIGAPQPILIQNYIYNNPATLPNFQAEIEETADFMELFYELYGPYPFEDEKYGHCMAPISGGMEHQTMTTQGFFEKGLTSHELGHQWWGNNVTCASWADIWINEGFASYSEYLMLENLYPAQKNQHMLDVHSDVMTQTGGSIWVQDSLNESRIFSGRLTYNKGAALVHTLRFMLNDDATFFSALQNFQNNFSDSVAKGTDIRDALGTAGNIDLTDVFDQWYFGEGYPTYSLRWNLLGNNLYLEISHTTSKPAVTPTFMNPIEIRLSRTGAPDTTIRFEVTNNIDQYFLANIGNVDYIVGIDPSNWIVNKVGTIVNDPNFTSLSSVDDQLESEFGIYPNPTDDLINILFKDSAEEIIVELTDAVGRQVFLQTIQKSSVINVSSISAGVYLMTLRSNNQKTLKTERVVIN